MPNGILLYVDSIASDRKSAIIREASSYKDNNLNLYLGNYKVNQDSVEVKELEVTDIVLSPETVAEPAWQVELQEDGWYRYPIVGIPNYSDLTEYNLYDAVFATGQQGEGVYRKTYDYPTSGSDWSPINAPSLWELIEDPKRLAYNVGEDNESANIPCGIYEVILSPNAEYEYANYLASLGKEVCSIDCSLQNLEVIIRLATVIDGMAVRSDRSEMPAGERLARRSETIIQELNATNSIL
jgi:hypothetical protein